MKLQWLFFLCLLANNFAQAQSDFFNPDVVQEIRIEFPQQNWRYLLDSLRYNGEELLEGTVDINGTTLEQAGVRYRDGKAFTPGGRRNGLYIDLAAFGVEQRYDSLTAIDLSSALRDPSMIREVLGLEMARTYLIAPRANFARVFINGDLYGLFVNQEVIDAGFLGRHFETDQGLLYHSDHEFKQLNDDDCLKYAYGSLQPEPSLDCYGLNWSIQQGGASFESLDALAKRLESGALLEEILDVDATLWMLAFVNATVHLNSYIGKYANNLYFYQDEDGRFTPLLSHLNLAFGSFKNTGIKASDLRTNELIELDPLLHTDNTARPLVNRLLDNDPYQKRYLSHYRTIVNEYFRGDTLAKRAKSLQDLIRPEIENDPNNYYSLEDFDRSLTETIGKRSRIPGLLRFADSRGDWLKQQSLFTFLPPRITDIRVEEREQFSSTKLDEFRISVRVEEFPKAVTLHYRWSPTEPFQQRRMLDDGSHFDGEARDDVFGAVIAPTKSTHTTLYYYIEAENARQIGFNPVHYRFEQHRTTIKEINQ